jgi:hypothetical protein
MKKGGQKGQNAKENERKRKKAQDEWKKQVKRKK